MQSQTAANEWYWQGEVENNNGIIEMELEVEREILALDKRERRAYQTAVDVFPELVKRETKIVDFLRTEGFDTSKAALRLARYWKYRKEIFRERWLLPMTQTGNGTLTMEEVNLLRAGYATYFSRAPSAGLLIVMDYSRVPENFDPKFHTRIQMYICTTLTDPMSQTEGITAVYVVRSRSAVIHTDGEGWEIFKTALPMKAKELIVARAFMPGREGLLDYMAYQTARVNEFRSGVRNQQLIGNSLRGTLALLEERGLDRKHLPVCVGGDYNYDQFNEWVRTRISIEDIMSPAPIRVNHLPIVSAFPQQQKAAEIVPLAVGEMVYNPSTGTSVNIASAGKEPVQNKKKKQSKHSANKSSEVDDETRKLNALYSRRAYHKRKLEMFALQEQVNALEIHNKKLKEEYQRLQTALSQAERFVRSHRHEC